MTIERKKNNHEGGKEGASGQGDGWFQLGYLKTAGLLEFFFNVSIAVFLLILSAPIMSVVFLLVWWREGRPVLYAGERLGRDKKPFTMYKFRTLVRDAEEMLGPEVLGRSQQLVTRTGKILRDTKLDELPQLWNIIKRDMDLVGPRPIRPLLYEETCKNIPGYDRRFQIRPGLIGFSQLFTPHASPKRIRSFIDNRLLLKKRKNLADIYSLFLTGLLVVDMMLRRLLKSLFMSFIPQKVLHRYSEKRRFDRIPVKCSQVYLAAGRGAGDDEYIGSIKNINPEAFLLRSRRQLEDRLPAVLKLKVEFRKAGRSDRQIKTAYCQGQIFRTLQVDGESWDYVIMYTPVSPFNFYLIQQYFLHDSMIHYS